MSLERMRQKSQTQAGRAEGKAFSCELWWRSLTNAARTINTLPRMMKRKRRKKRKRKKRKNRKKRKKQKKRKRRRKRNREENQSEMVSAFAPP